MSVCFNVLLAGFFGAIFGSFSTFVGYRLFNEKQKLTGSRSVCCNCGQQIKFYDLIPIFSFLLLRGKCRFCRKSIPFWHFLAELFTLFSFAYSVYFFNGFNVLSISMCVLCWCLITQSIIDYRVMMSSDVLHLIELGTCVIVSFFLGYDFWHIFMMMVFTICFFLLLSFIMKLVLKKDCLGFGDVKLFAILSVLFNFEGFVVFIGLCGFCGILFYVLKNVHEKFSLEKTTNGLNYEKSFPFIPSITIAFFLAFYIINQI